MLATSANLSGEPDLVKGRDVVQAFTGIVEAIIDSGPTPLGGSSAVISVVGKRVEVLRPGVVPEVQIRRAARRRILFVCTGNICRSPMAEGMLRTKLARRLAVPVEEIPDAGFHIDSAGTASLTGEPATEEAQRAAARYGVPTDTTRAGPGS